MNVCIVTIDSLANQTYRNTSTFTQEGNKHVMCKKTFKGKYVLNIQVSLGSDHKLSGGGGRSNGVGLCDELSDPPLIE